jgi:cytochrome c oxidase cbb3-type subunit 3
VERDLNRLLNAPVAPVAPVAPIAPIAPSAPVAPVAPVALLTLLTLLACGVSLLGCGDGDVDPASSAVARGAADYQVYCAVCHGEQGQGYAADNANALAHPAFLATATDDFLRSAIIRGRSGTPMSAWGAEWGGPLEDAAVDDMVTYLRAYAQGPPLDVHEDVVTGEVDRGASVYGANCATCHGEQGEGALAMSLNSPEFLDTASDGYLRFAIQVGRVEVGMPAFAQSLTAQAIDDLVVLIRSWAVDPNLVPPDLPVFDPEQVVFQSEGEEAVFTTESRLVPAAEIFAEYDAGKAMVLLDARPPADYSEGHIAGAISVPFYGVQEVLSDLPKDVWIVCYCACPHAESGLAADALEDAGFTRVKVLDEGVNYWEEQGYPMTVGVDP